jgi:S-DNA-T family DNA segregation ATPase FtsK/SpoIIIE
VRTPPALVLPEMLPPAAGHRVPIGIAEADLSPVQVDFAELTHLRVLGEAASGKSSLLRTVARGIIQANTPAEAIVALVDLRGSLRGVVPEDQLIGHAGTVPEAVEMIKEIAGALAERLPGGWHGPELYLLVDDLEQVTGADAEAFAPLADLLAATTGVGLHLVVARRWAGLAEALLVEPLASLRSVPSATVHLALSPPEPLSPPTDEIRPLSPSTGETRPRPPEPPGQWLPMPAGHARYRAGPAREQRIQLAWTPPAEA